MIVIYQKNESPQVQDVPLDDLKSFDTPHSKKIFEQADQVIVLEGNQFRIFKDRDEPLDTVNPVKSLDQLLYYLR